MEEEHGTYSAMNGGYILNVLETQTIEIEGPFGCQHQDSGWHITMQGTGRVLLQFRANMRRLDIPVLEGDYLVRTASDILVMRTHSAEEYRASTRAGSGYTSSQSTGSTLARSSTSQMGSPLATDVEEMVTAAENRRPQSGR